MCGCVFRAHVATYLINIRVKKKIDIECECECECARAKIIAPEKITIYDWMLKSDLRMHKQPV